MAQYGHHHHRSMHAMTQAVSPPTEPATPRNPFTPPTPPPVSSSAALPPYGYSLAELNSMEDAHHEGADIKRHQSLTHGYGSSSRVRDRLGRSPGLLTLDQRDDQQRGSQGPPHHTRTLSGVDGTTSPIGHNLWSPSQPLEGDGWSRPNMQQVQNAFDAMSLGRRMMGPGSDMVGPPQGSGNRQVSSSEEPSWVANLVGMSGEISPQPPVRSASAGAGLGGGQAQWSSLPPLPQPRWPGQLQVDQMQQPYMNMGGAQLGYLQQQQLLAAYGGLKGPGGMPFPMQPGHNQQMGGYTQPFPGFMSPFNNAGMYPNTPVTAPAGGANDAEVLELARKKGLNPASFECRPQQVCLRCTYTWIRANDAFFVQARFFVIKSYTEEDVQKSLKHEIWSSTVLGNKRLDTAFRESAEQMPIYLFFSVNGSRHFCGVAQMLTPWVESIPRGDVS
jgi:hypothetical protein